MKHLWLLSDDKIEIEYSWKAKEWNSFNVIASPAPKLINEASEEDFITEHYWGYTKINSGLTSQYEVAHPRWTSYDVTSYCINVDFGSVYGELFAPLTNQAPKSVMLAEGSKITVKAGSRIPVISR